MRQFSGIRKNQRGVALILNMLMLTVTVGMVGLAVDVGTLYIIKSRLSSAVDAAALAAGRSVNAANTVTQANTQATAMANQFFTANFPNGFMNTLGTPTLTPSFVQQTGASGTPNGTLNISMTASANAPTYFMNVFGVRSVTVSATGTATRRSLVMMLVLDQSSSMNTPTTPTACQAMKSAVQTFVQGFSPYDTIGMITFDYTAHLAVPAASSNTSNLVTAAGSIVCQNNTNTTAALELAYQQLQSQNQPLSENVIVLFTDGSPNGINANFPLRTAVDTRWGPSASGGPPQSGSTYGQTNSCANGANGGNNGICVNMPVTCTAGGTVTGTISQESSQNSYGGQTGGVFPPMDSMTVTYPGSCAQTGSYTRQMIAYIPDADLFGNSTHGVVSTASGPTVSGGLVTRDLWLHQANQECSPDPTVLPACKNVGDFWANHPTIGSVSNFFTAGAYSNKFRPDQPNTIVATSMNTAMAEAYKIRSDTTLNPVIHTIYLTGNGTDSVDREFLPIMANVANIPALPYDPLSYVPYPNPAFQNRQQQGQYLVTADRNQLGALFAQLSTEVLRLSH
jgi:Flp pilus assembly protein TadG